MSDQDPKSAQAESDQAAAAPPKRRSRKLVVFGGSAGLIVLVAWVLSLVAVPGKGHDEQHLLLGPFVVDISPRTGFQVNLADRGRHYLALSIKAEVDAFDQAYAQALA